MGMQHRITFDVLQSGQPRPYADTTRHARATFEVLHGGDPWAEPPTENEWKPAPDQWFPEASVREILRHAMVGFTDKPPANWASTRLDWLKKTAPGVWEFHTTSPFTD